MATVDQLIENIKSHPECVSITSGPTPEFLTQQINDTDTVLFDGTFNRAGNVRPIRFVLNITWLHNYVDLSQLHVQHLVDELVYCDEDCDICSDNGMWSYSNQCENMGTPPTYYIRPNNGNGQRLKAFPLPPVTLTAEIESLFDQVSQLPGVSRVEIEYLRHNDLIAKVGNNDGVVVQVFTSDPLIPVNVFYSLTLLNDTTTHPAILTNIDKLLAEHARVDAK
jgi:hypothetical protein